MTPLVARLTIQFLPGMYGSILMPWFCNQNLPSAGGRKPLSVPGGDLLVALHERLHALLVANEGVTMVAVRGTQLAGQDVGPDQGQAASLARQGGRTVAGVADEGDPPGRPAVHADLAGGVEVEVGGLWHGGEQPGHLPAIPPESGGQELLLLAAVTVVVVERVGGEEEGRSSLAIASRSRRLPTGPALQR